MLAMKHHPDKNKGSKESEEKFKQVRGRAGLVSLGLKMDGSTSLKVLDAQGRALATFGCTEYVRHAF